MCVWIEKDYLVLRPYAHIFCRWPMPTSDDHLWFTALQASITPCAGSPTIPSCFKIRTHPSPEINHPKTVPKWTFRLNCRAHFLDLSFSWSFSTVVLNQTYDLTVFFTLLGSTSLNPVRKMLMKLTPGEIDSKSSLSGCVPEVEKNCFFLDLIFLDSVLPP